VVDHGSAKVVRVDPATGHQHVVTSGGHLRAPINIAQDQDGNVLVVDAVGDKLIRIEPDSGVQTIVAHAGLLSGLRSVEVFGL
jgi:glucose/arabinose dehydrogenase